MKPTDLLESIKDAGLTVLLLPGNHLKVSPADKITIEIRDKIRQHKIELVAQISAEQSRLCKLEDLRPEEKPLRSVCFHGQQHSLDFVDDRCTPEEIPQLTITKRGVKPSPIALAWLSDHRQELDKVGWTRAELYRRNKSKRGIAWLKLWDKASLLPYLHDDGVIEFECSTNGRDFIQTARSASFWARPNDVLSVDQKT